MEVPGEWSAETGGTAESLPGAPRSEDSRRLHHDTRSMDSGLTETVGFRPGARGSVGPASRAVTTDRGTPDLLQTLAGVGDRLAAAALEDFGSSDFVASAEAAALIEGFSRTVEYLQLLAAATVDRTRTSAIADARDRPAKSGKTIWLNGANGQVVETVNEPDAGCHDGLGNPSDLRQNPADDGTRNTAEFLRLKLRIPIREARRRLTLAEQILPGTTLTGQSLPAPLSHLAAVSTPALLPNSGDGPVDDSAGLAVSPLVSSYAATVISSTVDRLRHSTSAENLCTMEQQLSAIATTSDPDILVRVAQRWVETIDADGAEPTEEALRHTQGAFIRKPRNGLHHLEIFATSDQYEHFLTVMNVATNPRSTTPSVDTDGDPDAGSHRKTEVNPEVQDGVNLERRTRPQQQLDGIISGLKAGLTTSLLPTTGGNRPQIIATIDHRDLFDTHAHGHGSSAGAGAGAKAGAGAGAGALVFTGPVAAATLRKIACDADIIPVVLGSKGEIIDIGRKARLFTQAQRLALTARDKGCAFPDCTIPAPWREAHHITYWSQGGSTATTNGVLLCSYHHHIIHKELWKIAVSDGVPTFIPPRHIDPAQRPRQNRYFKPPSPPL